MVNVWAATLGFLVLAIVSFAILTALLGHWFEEADRREFDRWDAEHAARIAREAEEARAADAADGYDSGDV